MKDILKRIGIIKKDKTPIEPFVAGNMYDLFINKKSIDKKDIHEYDGDDKVDWNSTYEGPKIRKFTIPVKGLTREESENQIKELMSLYHDDVEWIDPPFSGSTMHFEKE